MAGRVHGQQVGLGQIGPGIPGRIGRGLVTGLVPGGRAEPLVPQDGRCRGVIRCGPPAERAADEAERLFRERGYAATSLEQIADAADVTKGAIYGHFSSKEDLLLSAIEAAPTPDYGALLNDQSRPVRERLAEFGRSMATADVTTDTAGLAVSLEFVAALLRSPDALRRYGADLGLAAGRAGR